MGGYLGCAEVLVHLTGGEQAFGAFHEFEVSRLIVGDVTVTAIRSGLRHVPQGDDDAITLGTVHLVIDG